MSCMHADHVQGCSLGAIVADAVLEELQDAKPARKLRASLYGCALGTLNAPIIHSSLLAFFTDFFTQLSMLIVFGTSVQISNNTCLAWQATA